MTPATRIVELLLAWMRAAGQNAQQVAASTGIPQHALTNALDGEGELSPSQVARVGRVLGRSDREVGEVLLSLLLPTAEAA